VVEWKRLAALLPAPVLKPLVGAWRRMRGNPETHVLAILSDPERLAIDIGANAGDYAHWLARHARGCIAFEPNPELARSIEQKYGASGVRVHACALSDRDGQAILRIPMVDGQDRPALATVETANAAEGLPTRDVEVPLRRLDDFELDPVGVMKIDAEGHELAVLDGATRLIARDRPNIMVEVEERHKPGSVAAVRSFFGERGYEGFFLLGRRIAPIGTFDPACHQDPSKIINERVAIGATYVNNFLFTTAPGLIDRLSALAQSGTSL
jgi:FkbM family methyltransferase